MQMARAIRHVAALVVGWSVIAGVPGATAAEHTKDTLETVKKNLAAKKAVLIDVREQDEWDAGHLRGAVLMPLSTLPEKASGAALAKRIPEGTILYLHCAAGGRCLRAADLLRQTGYDVQPLRAGYEALRKAGFPPAAGQ